MTLEEARNRIPERPLPPFWVGDWAGAQRVVDAARQAEVTQIAESPGGRPLHLLAYGDREPRSSSANFNSAVGGRDLSAFLDRASRKKPVLLLIGPVHGHEVEGLTGLANLVAILETGRDLRGRAQSELHRLARGCRLLIVPCGNPDGLARFEPGSLVGMELRDIQFWGQGTWADGQLCAWPGCKLVHPMRGERAGWLGCYYNDAGINPMHDEFLQPMSPEAPALLNLARQEGPDIAVSLHSYHLPPAFLRPAFVPLDQQREAQALHLEFAELCEARGLPHGGAFDVTPEETSLSRPFNLSSALYHISGALSVTFECPHGVRGETSCPSDGEQILDIQLSLYEAMITHALEAKSRTQSS